MNIRIKIFFDLGILLVFSLIVGSTLDKKEINCDKQTKGKNKCMAKMNIRELPLQYPIRSSSDAILLYDNNQRYVVWDRTTLEEICHIDLKGEYVDPQNLRDGFILNLPQKNYCYIYRKDSNSFSKVFCENTIYHQLENGQYIGISKEDFGYVLLDADFNFIRSIEKNGDAFVEGCKQGLFEYSRFGAEKHYLQLRDPMTDSIVFKQEVEGKGGQHQFNDRYFVYRVKGEGHWFVYCFDFIKKEKVWKIKLKGFPKFIIDGDANSVVINSGKEYQEIRLDRYEIIHQFELERERKRMASETMRYLSKNGIFYYSSIREDIIGKMNRKTGEVEWEEDYLPEGCENLNIYFWEKVMGDKYLIFVQDKENPRLILMSE